MERVRSQFWNRLPYYTCSLSHRNIDWRKLGVEIVSAFFPLAAIRFPSDGLIGTLPSGD